MGGGAKGDVCAIEGLEGEGLGELFCGVCFVGLSRLVLSGEGGFCPTECIDAATNESNDLPLILLVPLSCRVSLASSPFAPVVSQA